MKRLLFPIFIVFLLVGAQTQSFGASYTMVYNDQPLPILLNNYGVINGGIINISFYLKNILPLGIYAPPYNISSASYSFSFTDNDDPLTPAGGYGTAYAYPDPKSPVLEATTVFKFINLPEGAAIAIGNNHLAYGTTPSFDETKFVEKKLTAQQIGVNWSFNNINAGPTIFPLPLPEYTIYNFYMNTYNEITGNKGNFNLSGELVGSNLQDLAQDGVITFSVYPQNSLYLTSASITFDARPNSPVPPTRLLPAITSLSPSSATVGGADFTLTINGSNFDSQLGSTLEWSGPHDDLCVPDAAGRTHTGLRYCGDRDGLGGRPHREAAPRPPKPSRSRW